MVVRWDVECWWVVLKTAWGAVGWADRGSVWAEGDIWAEKWWASIGFRKGKRPDDAECCWCCGRQGVPPETPSMGGIRLMSREIDRLPPWLLWPPVRLPRELLFPQNSRECWLVFEFSTTRTVGEEKLSRCVPNIVLYWIWFIVCSSSASIERVSKKVGNKVRWQSILAIWSNREWRPLMV